MTFRRGLFGLVAMSSILYLIGCSSGDSKGKGAAAACSDEGVARCLEVQMTCVGGATETCSPCGNGEYATPDNACTAIPGDIIPHDFGTRTLEPGQEIPGGGFPACQSWTLPNDEDIWINTVEMINDGYYHHSNWLWVPNNLYEGPDGLWDCNSRHATPNDGGYDELTAVASGGGVLFAQSTQAKHQVQKFKEGAAIRLPPHARVLANPHLLNTTADPQTTTFTINVYTIDAADVQVPLAPFRLTYVDLQIQPNAITNVSGSCDISASPGETPGDLNMELYYAMPHYHALGKSFELRRYGGASNGEVLYSIGAYDSEAHGKSFDPPVSMRGSQGFGFTCGFENPYDRVVNWGVKDFGTSPDAGEMCVMLGFGRANIAVSAQVLASDPTKTTVNGGVHEYTGDCSVISLPFSQGLGG